MEISQGVAQIAVPYDKVNHTARVILDALKEPPTSGLHAVLGCLSVIALVMNPKHGTIDEDSEIEFLKTATEWLSTYWAIPVNKES